MCRRPQMVTQMLSTAAPVPSMPTCGRSARSRCAALAHAPAALRLPEVPSRAAHRRAVACTGDVQCFAWRAPDARREVHWLCEERRARVCAARATERARLARPVRREDATHAARCMVPPPVPPARTTLCRQIEMFGRARNSDARQEAPITNVAALIGDRIGARARLRLQSSAQ